MNDELMLARAIHLAREHSSSGLSGPFGAVVARDGEILGEGWNQVVPEKDPTAHAEILAIRAAAARLNTHVLEGCTIYCSCEPCPMCLGAIYWARISRVVFAAAGEDARAAGFDDTVIAREIGLGWEQRAVASLKALEEQGKRVLEDWARNPGRVDY
jgi:guanine deaminase